MKVFISWSGTKSHKLAEALYGWLPMVLETVEPFLSSDMAKGISWSREVGEQLDSTTYGLICITPANSASTWLNFEAGALSKRIELQSHVVPIGIGFKSISELKMPMGMFQGMLTSRDEFMKLVSDMNSSLEIPLRQTTVDATFNFRWPELENAIIEVKKTPDEGSPQAARDSSDLLQEVLNTVRDLARQVAATRMPSARDSPPAYEDVLNRPLRTGVSREAPKPTSVIASYLKTHMHMREGEDYRLEELESVSAHIDTAREFRDWEKDSIARELKAFFPQGLVSFRLNKQMALLKPVYNRTRYEVEKLGWYDPEFTLLSPNEISVLIEDEELDHDTEQAVSDYLESNFREVRYTPTVS